MTNAISRPQIIVLDAFPTDAGDMDWTALHQLGDLTLYPHSSPDQVGERIQAANIVYTNKVQLPFPAFEAASELQMVSVLATGYDVIDLAAARRAGVTVCNVPAYSTASTAQTTVALLLELTHHVGAHSAAVGDGDWSRSASFSFWNFPLVELERKTLLLIGTGSIGARVGAICQALGMNVVSAQLPGRGPKGNSPFPRLPLDQALPLADVVSLHCPATPETRGLVDDAFLSQMKPSAFLINTARGVLIDENAVAHALHNRNLAGFAADVLAVEPPPADHPLIGAPHCILTPHIGWASIESRRRLIQTSIQNLKAFLDGTPQNVVS